MRECTPCEGCLGSKLMIPIIGLPHSPSITPPVLCTMRVYESAIVDVDTSLAWAVVRELDFARLFGEAVSSCASDPDDSPTRGGKRGPAPRGAHQRQHACLFVMYLSAGSHLIVPLVAASLRSGLVSPHRFIVRGGAARGCDGALRCAACWPMPRKLPCGPERPVVVRTRC